MDEASRRGTAVVVGLALALAACGAPSSEAGRGTATSGAPAVEGTLEVFAAASLGDAFAELAHHFEAAHPGVDVRLNLAGSSTLAWQITEGAPADVFASADRASMQRAAASGDVATEPLPFAANRLAIAVPRGNPGGISALEDLARGDLLIGLCAPAVPCGRLARQVLARGGVVPAVDSEEPDVRALLAKLEAGELDAGLVYRSDLVAAGGTVEGIDLPAQLDVAAEYVIAPVRPASAPAVAFIDHVLGPGGAAVLERHGFDIP